MRRSTPAALSAVFLCLPIALAQKSEPAQQQPAARPTDLPITHVSLYKNGVGFFEHTGHVTGNAEVTIDFTSSQLNDVLQSLTAIDLNGGRITGAGYNSATPLDQQLKNLPLALGEDPTALEFYQAIRGARVEVHSGAVSITGRLLSIEERTTPPADSNDTRTPTQKEFLTIVSDTGEARTLELTSTTSVRLLDTRLHTDVNAYLQLLDSTRNQGLRHLILTDRGTGTRELHLSYISEVPIWKSTYRILFTDHNKPGGPSFAPSAKGEVGDAAGEGTATATLQGWSVVDNTTGTDWNNVHLSLIAGSPQSFIQPLSQPIYSRRPEIPIAQEAQLTPQTYDSSIEDKAPAMAPPPPPPGMPLPAKMRSRSVHGVMGGVAGGSGMGYTTESVEVNSAAPALSYEEAATESLITNTKTAAFDDFFAYNLTDPVTIRKNESALVPTLQTKITADRVTLVTSNGTSTSQPLRALWITNTSGQTLDRGSFSIVEDGNFGGEGLLDPIHPDEKRLLSYAADQAVHVSAEKQQSNSHVTFLRGSKGGVNIHRSDFHEVTYVLHNAAAEPRTVVLEHPIEKGFKLDDATPKPTETTASVYRFRVDLAPGATTKLHVGGDHPTYTYYRLDTADDNQLTFILKTSGDNPTLQAALQPILEARRRVADAQLAVDQTNARLTTLRTDEDRQRANITALATADKTSRERFVRDLNKTEDTIAAAQSDLATRTTTLEAAKADLATRIDAFAINTK
jgi:hypothetical protein